MKGENFSVSLEKARMLTNTTEFRTTGNADQRKIALPLSCPGIHLSQICRRLVGGRANTCKMIGKHMPAEPAHVPPSSSVSQVLYLSHTSDHSSEGLQSDFITPDRLLASLATEGTFPSLQSIHQ